MPPSTLDQLLHLIQRVEQGHPWPSQKTTGTVAALAKTPEASARARQCLDFRKELVPRSLIGNIAGRSPKHVWYHIRKHAYGSTSEIAGSTIDLVKCFNTLPRDVLQDIAAHVGLPEEVMQPWSQALRQMTRRFPPPDTLKDGP